MIASYLRKRESAAFESFGLDRQAEFFEREADRLGQAPPVIDANDVLEHRKACWRNSAQHWASRGIAAMLSWAPGRRGTDGPWAPHWYGAVEKSRGFGPPETGPVDLPEDARRLADRCRPFYEQLAIHRIKPPGA